ncbi:aldehyde ferredoxin oxidoreductase family protein [Natronobacterium gregoryi]|uniref:Aldehyde ferredoxin oxidoreductase n=2 Tax=Natronobacterium gregoryi TaxID=44930 RepID=L0AJI8_NATGS|nr:aldehyde ferredoxin oxidoreductase C-terminal domain-containing protein [Natronobacterium gregoryi]AFZ74063.1 aldehyde:ferredoxin oxidoreductase [Natronobacterium gregoryi SP2]ELY70365.1 aldehyde ferredoxin oxidoreductase [Natronobacterium gregoryi SP2]PLK20805.1 aldehyde ferredoxin oxidoreductase [Natronobacterium gregoryi SP2]SFJ06469.1 aldehyde:ferredoxin oxidoreductase [Natronobacterium gregoryi]
MVGRSYVLRVDLTAGTVRKERVPERWRRQFLGGKGIGGRYLYAELDAGVDPLGPENVLAFCVGPLAGTLPGESRYAAVTKSPLTGLFLDSYAGGTFAERLAGSLEDCLALLVTGESDEPVHVVLEGGTAAIEPAETWSHDTVETAEAYSDAAIACIGPAGENEVRYATIASDAGDHHAGRGGAGAVMGSKRLKAVVAAGPPAEPPTAELARLREEYTERYASDDTGIWQAASGTLESVDFADEVDALATEGWQESAFEGTPEIGVDAVREAASGREYPDESVPGGFRVETEGGETVPRGATQMSLGAGLGIDDFDVVAMLGERCDRLGVDVISAGNVVAWAVRASQTDAIDADLEFGDGDAARALVEAIAVGADPPCDQEVVETLREGVDAAAARFGTEQIPTVKSMELPAYDPRGAAGMALAYATSDRGGCHRRARPIEAEVFEAWDRDERITAVKTAQDVRSVLWSLVADDFAGETMWHDCGATFLEALDEASDLSYPTDALRLYRTGERIWTLVRLFNVREGVDRSDDRLPESLLGIDDRVDPDAFERLLDAYYRTRGWGTDGRPTEDTLERLALAAVRDEATPVGTVFDRSIE